MITLKDAERIAGDIKNDDPDGVWTLEEFKEGWLFKEARDGNIGAASTVIERATGKVMRFPSSVPPGRILKEYEKVRDRGHEAVGKK
jgi:hypothetical protein